MFSNVLFFLKVFCSVWNSIMNIEGASSRVCVSTFSFRRRKVKGTDEIISRAPEHTMTDICCGFALGWVNSLLHFLRIWFGTFIFLFSSALCLIDVFEVARSWCLACLPIIQLADCFVAITEANKSHTVRSRLLNHLHKRSNLHGWSIILKLTFCRRLKDFRQERERESEWAGERP